MSLFSCFTFWSWSIITNKVVNFTRSWLSQALYIYIYIERERERERACELKSFLTACSKDHVRIMYFRRPSSVRAGGNK
jgi:hypothetical protein